MSAAVTCAPTSPKSKVDNAIITVTGQPQNDVGSYDATKKPSEPPIVCYIKAQAPSGSTPALDLRTPLFSTDGDGHKSLPFLFPVAGTWVVTLRNSADDSQLATLSVTVS